MSIKQAFAWWAFASAAESPDSMLAAAAAIGYRGVDFLPEELWPRARDLGFEIVIMDGHVPLELGFNDRARHRALGDQVRRAVDTAASAGVPFVSVASGDRVDSIMDGLKACVDGIAPLAAEAHAVGVVLLLEPLNTKIDHPGHECDRTAWAASVVDQVSSPGLRILYDFYHAQIMEGDLLRTVDKHWPNIAHFHTAGVPGRHELDDRQEINWLAVAHHLHQHGYDGYVTHELIPRGNPMDALRQAFELFSLYD